MKQSPRTHFKAVKAFTLIELLVVIAIIAILMGLLFPAFSSVRESARKTQAKNDEMNIVTAVKAYYTEYGKYPITTGASDVGYSANNNNIPLDILRNMTGTTTGNTLNPRGIVFIEVPAAKDQNNPKSGIKTSTGVWYDPWGSAYNIAIDGDYDNQLNGNTKLTNFYTDVGSLQTGVIVWALGKNGALGGGPASGAGFSSEGGKVNQYSGSGDVISWQ